jgi:hypothetical protein
MVIFSLLSDSGLLGVVLAALAVAIPVLGLVALGVTSLRWRVPAVVWGVLAAIPLLLGLVAAGVGWPRPDDPTIPDAAFRVVFGGAWASTLGGVALGALVSAWALVALAAGVGLGQAIRPGSEARFRFVLALLPPALLAVVGPIWALLQGGVGLLGFGPVAILGAAAWALAAAREPVEGAPDRARVVAGRVAVAAAVVAALGCAAVATHAAALADLGRSAGAGPEGLIPGLSGAFGAAVVQRAQVVFLAGVLVAPVGIAALASARAALDARGGVGAALAVAAAGGVAIAVGGALVAAHLGLRDLLPAYLRDASVIAASGVDLPAPETEGTAPFPHAAALDVVPGAGGATPPELGVNARSRAVVADAAAPLQAIRPLFAPGSCVVVRVPHLGPPGADLGCVPVDVDGGAVRVDAVVARVAAGWAAHPGPSPGGSLRLFDEAELVQGLAGLQRERGALTLGVEPGEAMTVGAMIDLAFAVRDAVEAEEGVADLPRLVVFAASAGR